ncbi:arylesterase [Herminiimonas fonticola]|uniref:Acyl-CoA thioesterase-1 n=1 Tax=Herminiimonas fonticola TaxID=303380 RepID=A0A4R6G1Q8_9BURK|nr:arylesterase [Herminiimonas fonticola]RBA23452.1 Lysophospholipase L1 and related esterase [Herminiimonas fonticola]TDN88293.1 acyl-CoA thioesterase-1 [Herminiimonas fonticola]
MRINFRFSYQVGKIKAILQAVALVALTSFGTSAYSASKTILVLGDSLSAEYGLVRGEGWVSLLQKKLETEKITAPIVNASISGETTSGGKARLPALLAKHQPAIVVIELGANDALRGLSLAATQENLRSMISSSKGVKAKVLLVGMQIPPNYGGDYTKQFAALFPKLAKENKTSLVPFMLQGVAEKPELFQADRIHPSAEAHPKILNNIWPQLQPLISSSK